MGHVTANGIEISFEEHGVDVNGTMVLICGTGQPAVMWSALGTVDTLVGAGYRVVTFDNRGMAGAACPTPPWTVGDMADDAIAVLEQVAPAHVLGASLGALITQTVALRRPDLVRTATFMVGGGQFGALWQRLMLGITPMFASGAEFPIGLQQFFMAQAMLNPEQRNDPTLVQLAIDMAGGLTDTFGPGGQYGQYSANATWITEDHVTELADMQPPVLVIGNQFDPIFPSRDLRSVAAAVPNGEFVEIPDASHVAIDPVSLELTMAALLNFLSSRKDASPAPA